MRPFFAYRLLSQTDAGAVDQTAQPAKGFERELDGRPGVLLASHVGLEEARALPQVQREGFAGGSVHVGDDRVTAIGDDHLHRSCAQTRAATGDDESTLADVHVWIASSK